MNKTPLFEGNKTKKGKSFDRIGTKKDGLKLKWGWGGQNEKEPSQVCGAEIGHFKLRVIKWHYGYEAVLAYGKYSNEKNLLNVPDPMLDENDDRFKTRLECQIYAESLIIDFNKEVQVALVKVTPKTDDWICGWINDGYKPPCYLKNKMKCEDCSLSLPPNPKNR